MRDAIPLTYGKFVGVAPGDPMSGWNLLFFERPDQTIVAIYVNTQKGTISPNMVEIPRR